MTYQPPPGGYPPAPQQGYAPTPQQGYAPQPQGYPAAPQPQYAPPGPPAPQYAPPGAFPQPQGYPPQQQYQQPWPGAPTPGPSQGYRQYQQPPTGNAGNPMAGLGDADPTGSRLPHFNSGRRYVLKNDKIEFFQGRSDNYVTSEWTILESDDPMLPAGRAAKYMIKWDQDMSLPNFKAMLGALMGLSDKNEITVRIGEKEGGEAIDANLQPHRGKLVELRTEATKTKSGNDFTVHNWYPHSGAAAGVSPAAAPAALLPYHPQAAMMGQGYQPQMAAPEGQYAPMGAAAAPPPYTPPAAFAPPAGWYPHQQPGYFHNNKEAITEAELRQRMLQGRA